MANVFQGLLARLTPGVPGAGELSEADQRAIRQQQLLGLASGLLSSRTGGNFGAALGQGIQSGLLAGNDAVDNLQKRRYQQMGSAEMQGFNQLIKDLSPEEQARAKRVKLGLDPRAVTSAAKSETFTDADGVPRTRIFDPTTQTYKVMDDAGNWIQASPFQSAAPAAQAPQLLGAGDMPIDVSQVTEPGLRAQIEANPQVWGLVPSGATMSGNMAQPPQVQLPSANLFRGRRPEDEAAAVSAAQANAKNASELAYAPSLAQVGVNAAIQQASGVGQVQADIKQAEELQDKARKNARALEVFDTALTGLRSGLSGATTNPLVGRLPALTANQQIAEGSVAALAPVLKEVFRSAGEGAFTDKDQELLLNMVPTRSDLPAAREAKLANVQSIVNAKLGGDPRPASAIRASMGAPQSTPGPTPKAATRKKFNPATGRIE